MTTTKRAKIGKTAISAVIGGIAGFAAMTAFLKLGGDPVKSWEGGRIAAGGVGIVYLLTGLLVLLGAALPGIGAKVLNVSDEEELREQRTIMMGSAWSLVAWGLMLVCLAGAGPGGYVPDAVAIATIAVALASGVVIYWRQWRLYDELWRQMSWESSACAMNLLFPILVIWAGAAHLGYAGPIDPLGIVALAAATVLAGAFIALGRRGLLASQ